jgi:hypothetical protein
MNNKIKLVLLGLAVLPMSAFAQSTYENINTQQQATAPILPPLLSVHQNWNPQQV